MALGFWSLPGAAVFADEVARCAYKGGAAVLALPPGVPDGLGPALAARVREQGREWVCAEARTDEDPAGALAWALGYELPAMERTRALAGELRATVALVRDPLPQAWPAWRRFLSEFAGVSRAFRPEEGGTVLLAAAPAAAEGLREDVNLRVLHWRGRLSRADTTLYVATGSPGASSLEQRLRQAVAIELAGPDVVLASKLAELPLAQLLDPLPVLREEARSRGWAKPPPKDRWAAGWEDQWGGTSFVHSAALAALDEVAAVKLQVWRGEIAVLFPAIEEKRVALLPTLRTFLQAPIETPLGRVETVEDLEIGQIWHQVRPSKLGAATKTIVMGLSNMRRAIAHVEPVDPVDLANAGFVDRAALTRVA